MLLRKMWILGLVVAVAMAMAGCGGGGDSTDSSQAEAAAELSQETTPTPTPTPDNAASEMPDEEVSPGDVGTMTPSENPARYQTAYDPDATYTLDDITMRGSYLKINLNDLTSEQLNRVVHRLRSEFCTCGCPKDPIDQCLINDPACGTAVSLANQIIREEKAKG